ncbi:MAG: MBL fold metallo-hydrolase [Rhodospirillales bacterium]|jgi:glyoxylase-like metal-dependent hydrolase (beta-lactamase superfamily II)/rhodanese-related sulfurtransferase|nr:hydrolase glyoxylase [Rhodospirillaceae bacterium]MDP6427667.1 MBL fold metallo-hydrolase [Rhodospirillales bacterium]MDP6645493.1 MBL fold metallo-hydrolase [Rhodospirillales bacterium]MDP6843457.1 MBL fold metallo-hydrolase [Rhodospirillales bacterium]|tara:strand:- start:442 stop:1488 length:1047 start_codon:yes stop_codon:yes gene_type:complete
MLFRQLFDGVSYTYTYLIAPGEGGEALIIDPVLEQLDRYLQLLEELDLRLVKSIDTHVHADHISAIGALRDKTSCVTMMGRQSMVDVVSMRIDDGDKIEIEGIRLDAIYTPGHTDDSYCFAMSDRVLTGDALFIRGTGRTDFQHGDAIAGYDSLFNKLLTLPDETLVYPGHDYKGDTVSTIGEERRFNPRLQVGSAEEYAAIMDNLGLPNPKLMDVAVPANMKMGLEQMDPEIAERSLAPGDAKNRQDTGGTIFVDLRETDERLKTGVIEGSVHVPYQRLGEFVRPGGTLSALATGDKPILLYCAYGERSALALKFMRGAGFENIRHLAGGIDAWINSGAAVEAPEEG